MLKLSKTLLHRGFSAVVHHGYGSFFPEPPELAIVKANWTQLKSELADVDLDTYEGYSPIWAFAPKSRLNVRRVCLLHPVDFILYTSLVLGLREGISKVRLPSNRVFSYRTENTPPNRLYSETFSWKDFRQTAISKVKNSFASGFIGITDIADFYPRIYQHRLINALQVTAGPAEKGYIRALEKMLFRFSEGTSYGIPVGPPASRLLGEAVLVDVDSSLISFGIDFIRYVDDFVLFANDAKDAEFSIRVLGETLFQNHGLTLQTAKTKVLSASEYLEKHLTLHSEKEAKRRELLDVFGGNPYEITAYEDLEDEQKREIDAFNLSEMLEEALSQNENVD